jgi:hypothetical protein
MEHPAIPPPIMTTFAREGIEALADIGTILF